MEGIGSAVHNLVEDGADVAVGVLDGVKAQLPVGIDGKAQVGSDELGEEILREEGVNVEAVIRAEGRAIQQAGSRQRGGQGECLLQV